MSPKKKNAKGSKGQSSSGLSPEQKNLQRRRGHNVLAEILGSEAECSDTISGSPSLSTSGEEVNPEGGEREVVSTPKKETKKEFMKEPTPEQEETPKEGPDDIINELTIIFARLSYLSTDFQCST